MAAPEEPISFAAAAAKDRAVEAKAAPVRVVQLEGQVVLKVAKHCKESATATNTVTGQLLGLDVGQTLEVTDAFPYPVRAVALGWW